MGMGSIRRFTVVELPSEDKRFSRLDTKFALIVLAEYL